jgi:hypothetical protein
VKADEVAERLWPGPDPVNFCRREVIRHLGAFDRKLKIAINLRTRIDPIIFEDLTRLWINPNTSERRLVLLLSELRAAASLLQQVTEMLAAARLENSIRFHDERLLEREEKRGVRD